MAQVVRKIIKDVHPEMVAEESFYTLLIDGNSLLFRCMADTKINSDGIHYGAIFQFLLQIKLLLKKRPFKYIYCTFDDEFSGWMRWNIYKSYKSNRDKDYYNYGVSDYMKEMNQRLSSMRKYLFNKDNKYKERIKSDVEKFIDENFSRERDILCEIFNELYIRWQIDDVTEGDDLIAYWCKNKKKNEKICIVTGDMDISQLLSDDICIYNLNNKQFISNKNFKDIFGYPYENILPKKILCGDSSDNIGNIKGLSEKRLEELIPEYKNREISIDEVRERAKKMIDERIEQKKKPLEWHKNIVEGISNKTYEGDFYEINEILINLKKPILSDDAKEEIDNLMYTPQDPEGRSFNNLYEIIVKYGLDELKDSNKFSSFFQEYKVFVDREIDEYKKTLK